MTPIEAIGSFILLAIMLVLVFAIIKVIFELLYIIWKLLWLVFGIPARLLRILRRRIP